MKDSDRLSSTVTGILWANLGCKLRRQLLRLYAKKINVIIHQKHKQMNAKQEFLMTTGGLHVLCAIISYYPTWGNGTTINLKVGYTEEEYQRFLKNLDFEYDNGYGTQHLFGTIWCDSGVWYDRHEYDGSECWSGNVYPAIPQEWGDEVVVEGNPEDYPYQEEVDDDY
jgi:hypothetical protein